MGNTQLKIKIIQSGRRAYEIERELDLWPSKLSKIIAGIIEPTHEEKVCLAEVLNCPIAEIFPSEPVEAE